MSKRQRAAINQMLGKPRPPGTQSVAEMRAGFAAMMAKMQIADGVKRSESTLAGLRAVVVEPDGDAKPGTILYFHGGSYVVGSPETAMSLTSALVARTGVRALSLDYRLAPEHPFPAAFDDALAAYRALLDAGNAPGSIAFADESAGGGVAIATCLLARDAGLPMPAAAAIFSAGLDMMRSGASVTEKAGIDPFFTREGFAHTGAMMLDGADPKQPLLSPATLADLTGFPPLLVQVGTNELLLDDSTRLAERAWRAGVDVILDVTADVPHVFQAFTGILDEADEALDRAARFLALHLSKSISSARDTR